MPPTFPHAVFTPENCLAVGGQFYTTALLGQSLEGLKLQEDNPGISNKDLSDSVYHTLGGIIRACGAITSPDERARISSSYALFRDPLSLTSKSYDGLSGSTLKEVLMSWGTPFDLKATKKQLIELLSKGESKARKEFREATESLSNKLLQELGVME